MAISTITHQGKEVIYIDYSECTTQEDMLQILLEAADHFRNSPKSDILTMSNFHNAFAGPDFMNEAKRLKEVFDSKTAKGAILGITGVKKILLNGYNLIARKKLVPFETKEDALDYLVS